MSAWQPVGLAAALWLGVTACGAGPPGPDEVAARFWSALRAGDTAAASELALPVRPERLEGLAARPLEAVELHDVLRDDVRAVVETHLPRADPADPLRFYTHLVRTDAGWRVDAERTGDELRRTALARSYEDAEEAIRKTTRAITDAIERGAEGAARALEEALEAVEPGLPPRRPGPEGEAVPPRRPGPQGEAVPPRRPGPQGEAVPPDAPRERRL